MKVLIVNPSLDYSRMFLEEGWHLAQSLHEADLVQFTGGADVTPSLYGHDKHPTTMNNPERDRMEILIFKQAVMQGKALAGICRGGQFLNVMCGGTMWQDVDRHTASHLAKDLATGTLFLVSSTHHQMMQPGPEGQLLAVAFESTRRTECRAGGRTYTVLEKQDGGDPEVVLYPKMRALCFQPHPEFEGARYREMREWYFDYLRLHLNVGKDIKCVA